MAEEERA